MEIMDNLFKHNTNDSLFHHDQGNKVANNSSQENNKY